jgi:hypothetical protein
MNVKEWSPESMLEVTLADPDKFLIVAETLERIGVASKRNNTLFQTCHILHKQGRYFIVHFKELFILDGKPSTLDESDVKRRNRIGILLHDWGLVDLVKLPDDEDCADLRTIKVVKHRDKESWTLSTKYQIGNKS